MSKKNKHKSQHESKQRGSGADTQNNASDPVQPNKHDVGNEAANDGGQPGAERSDGNHQRSDRRDHSSTVVINGVTVGLRAANGKLPVEQCPRCKHCNYSPAIFEHRCAWCGWTEGDSTDPLPSNKV